MDYGNINHVDVYMVIWQPAKAMLVYRSAGKKTEKNKSTPEN